MPYVRKTVRESLDVGEFGPQCAGDLNYLFTKLAIAYVKEHGLSYQRLNDVVGALDGAKAEFQRRVVAPYEDTKIRENGDVYPASMTGTGA
jgi:hypothetical protein